MAPRHCSLTGAVFFASRRRRLRRPLPPPSTPSAPAAAAVPLRRWTHQSRLLCRRRPIAPPLILLASSPPRSYPLVLAPRHRSLTRAGFFASRRRRHHRPLPPPSPPPPRTPPLAAVVFPIGRGRSRRHPHPAPSSIGSSPQPTSMVNAVISTSGPTARPAEVAPVKHNFIMHREYLVELLLVAWVNELITSIGINQVHVPSGTTKEKFMTTKFIPDNHCSVDKVTATLRETGLQSSNLISWY
uniref:Uncharacterized protein n=1 Tax=Oryza rufipogon TaxID=4529 RepID=A0A0E0NX48_ORYRU